MSNLIIPEGYKNLLDFSQTEKAIKLIKDSFQQNLSSELKLKRVTAPLFVVKGTGINDDLRKAHIGEVQSSIWSPEMTEECRKNNIMLF
jgi:asparagine synthetase A